MIELNLDVIRNQAQLQKLFHKDHPLLVENAEVVIALCDRIQNLEQNLKDKVEPDSVVLVALKGVHDYAQEE